MFFVDRMIVKEIDMEAFSKRDGKLEPIASQLKTLIIFFLESEVKKMQIMIDEQMNEAVFFKKSLWYILL